MNMIPVFPVVNHQSFLLSLKSMRINGSPFPRLEKLRQTNVVTTGTQQKKIFADCDGVVGVFWAQNEELAENALAENSIMPNLPAKRP